MANELANILHEIQSDQSITLGEIVDKMQENALTILCLISILPFMQPIPIPGLSSLLGAVITLQGIGLLITGRVILPERLKKVEISPEKFHIITKTAIRFEKITSYLCYFPNTSWINSSQNKKLCGAWIILLSLVLSLPLPIPFSNFVPAFGILLICLGLLKKDAALNLLGQVYALGFIISIYFLGGFAWEGFLS